MKTALKIENLSIRYNKIEAINNLSLNIPSNNITSIIGPSGCGKSTLLYSLNGSISSIPNVIKTGDIFLDNINTNLILPQLLKTQIGLVFQSPTPFPMSIYDNLVYVAKFRGIRDKELLKNMVKESLILVGLWDEIKGDVNRNALSLSGGQQQRLCIARALTATPKVLLLDEPCSALDIKSTLLIENLLLKLKNDYTIIIVTHNMAQAKRISDYTVFLQDGTLIEIDKTHDLFQNPKKIETLDFIRSELLY